MISLVVILTVRNDSVESFRTFEHHAARVMARYGGAIERTIVVPSAPESPTFREVHIVTFPDDAAFARYREDEELRTHGHLREASVVNTEVLAGVPGPRYDARGR
jgi:hypothetical protein